MKKILCVMLAFVMLLSVALTGCSGGSDSNSGDAAGTNETSSEGNESADNANTGGEEPYNVVITLYYVGTAPADLEQVQEAINEITVEKVNCTVTLLPVSFSEANAKFSLWIANGEKVDLVSSISLEIGTYIESNSIVQLDDMLQEHAPYVSSLEERYLGTRYKGGVYGLPVMQRAYGSVGGLAVRTDIMKEVGLNYEQYDLITYKEIDEMFALVHEKYPEMVTYGFLGTLNQTASRFFIPIENFNMPSVAAGALMNGGIDTTEIVNYFETDEYKEYLEWMRKWNQAGYISADAATTTESPQDWLKAGRCFSGANQIAEPGSADSMSDYVGQDMTMLYQQEPAVKSETYSAAPWVIPVTSERPEKALEFLDLMYENAELANLIQYGIEGVHYEKTDDEMIIDLYEDRAYKNDFGLYGDKMQVYMGVPNKSSVYEESVVFNEKALEKTSTAVGYSFVSENVTTELAALSNVISEYVPSLEYGFVDVDSVLPKFQEALRDAGIEKVIAENQKQFDEWLNSQE